MMSALEQVVTTFKAMTNREREEVLLELHKEGLLGKYELTSWGDAEPAFEESRPMTEGDLEAETRRLRDMLTELAGDDEVTVEAKPAKKGSWGGRRPPFWLKTITGWDDSKKGGFRLEGDFVRKAGDLPDGTLLAMGMTVPDGDGDTKKQYALMRTKKGFVYSFHGPKSEVDVNGVVMKAGPFDRWAEFEKAAK